MLQIYEQLKKLDWFDRNDYKVYLKKLINETTNLDEIKRYNNVISLIEKINFNECEFVKQVN